MLNKIICICLIVIAFAVSLTFMIFMWFVGALIIVSSSALFIFLLNFIVTNLLLRLKFCNMTDEEYCEYIRLVEEKKSQKANNG